MAPTTGIENGSMPPTMLWVHRCDRTLQRLTSSWICWLSNQLADDCYMFCKIKMFFKSQNMKDLSVGDRVISSGPSIDLLVLCSTWPDRPWGVLHLGTKRHWLNHIMMWCQNLSWPQWNQIIFPDVFLCFGFFCRCCLSYLLLLRAASHPYA